MPMKNYHVQVPVVLDLEVLSGLEPAAIEEGIKKRFAGVADPFCGTQVFFGAGYSVGHMMARTRNATLIPDGDVTITLDNEQR
jgi:hypothetical protein